jgi:hypothetical protein
MKLRKWYEPSENQMAVYTHRKLLVIMLWNWIFVRQAIAAKCKTTIFASMLGKKSSEISEFN